MGKIAARLAKKIIITDDNPRFENAASIRKQILNPIKKQRYLNIPDRGKAIKLAIQISSPNEVILVAGKGHETYQDYGSYVKKFSDKNYHYHSLQPTRTIINECISSICISENTF